LDSAWRNVAPRAVATAGRLTQLAGPSRVCIPAATATQRERSMRSILLYFLGIPIPIILLLAMCTHHF
jgi:hypothetical protein